MIQLGWAKGTPINPREATRQCVDQNVRGSARLRILLHIARGYEPADRMCTSHQTDS